MDAVRVISGPKIWHISFPVVPPGELGGVEFERGVIVTIVLKWLKKISKIYVNIINHLDRPGQSGQCISDTSDVSVARSSRHVLRVPLFPVDPTAVSKLFKIGFNPVAEVGNSADFNKEVQIVSCCWTLVSSYTFLVSRFVTFSSIWKSFNFNFVISTFNFESLSIRWVTFNYKQTKWIKIRIEKML